MPLPLNTLFYSPSLTDPCSGIEKDPFLNEMNKENEPPVSLNFDDSNKENEPPLEVSVPLGETETVGNVENVENVENVPEENVDKENDGTLVEEDPEKENRDPNAVRRSQRMAKKPLRLAQEKVLQLHYFVLRSILRLFFLNWSSIIHIYFCDFSISYQKI